MEYWVEENLQPGGATIIVAIMVHLAKNIKERVAISMKQDQILKVGRSRKNGLNREVKLP